MSQGSFRSVGWVAGVAATALGCYMVNLQVASERAELEEIENRIVLAQRDIRLLQTEIGTRGRLAQLEQWNVKVLALSAPQAHQFLEGSFQLASLTAPKKVVDPAAPVVLASAEKPAARPVFDSDGAEPAAQQASGAAGLMHTASLKREQPQSASAREEKTVEKPVERRLAAADVAPRPAKPRTDSGEAAAKPIKPTKSASKPAAKPQED